MNPNINDMYSWEIDYGADGTIDVETELSSLEDASYIIETSDLEYGDKISISLIVKAPSGAKCDWPCIIEMDAKKVPLGGSYIQEEGECFFKVYVPTKIGGTLQIKAAATAADDAIQVGDFVDLRKPNDPSIQLTFDRLNVLGDNQNIVDGLHGWYYFRSTEATNQTGLHISSLFDQDMMAMNSITGPDPLADKPVTWDYWYYPNFETSNGPNLFSTAVLTDGDWSGAPLEKYDNIFGTTAKQTELSYFDLVADPETTTQSVTNCGSIAPSPISGWHGHCQGGAIASLLYQQPVPNTVAEMEVEAAFLLDQGVPVNSDAIFNLSADDLEGLYAAYYETSSTTGNVDGYGDYWYFSLTNKIAEAPQSIGGEIVDRYCGKFHQALERGIGESKRPILANLRASTLESIVNGIPQSNGDQVWNQNIYRYTASYMEEEGDPHRSRVTVKIYANQNTPYPSPGLTERTIDYVYTIKYGSPEVPESGISYDSKVGNTFVNHPDLNWISASGGGVFTPGTIAEVSSISQIAPLTTTVNGNISTCNNQLTIDNILALDKCN